MQQEYVWYACYGSNLMEQRFLAYIKGGTINVNGHLVSEKGCKNPALPLRTETYRISYRLIFAGHFSKWENGSAAFLDTSRPERKLTTLSRIYLITREQFSDVVSQENGGIPSIEIDYEKLKETGSMDVLPDQPYGKLLYLEDKDDIPIVTFSCPQIWADTPSNSIGQPIKPYLDVIRSGLVETGLSTEEAVSYLQVRLPSEKDFFVVPTDIQHRNFAGNEYVIGMNSRTRKEYSVKKYAVVKNIIENVLENGTMEWRTLTAFGKVVLDESLPDDVLAVDQTLRNAIGLPFRRTEGERVRLAALQMTLGQSVLNWIHPGQCLFMRVNMASPLDMEKNSCRIPEDAFTVMRSKQGEHIWIENCVPLIPDNNEGPLTFADGYNEPGKDSAALKEWTHCKKYRFVHMHLRAYTINDKSEEAINRARELSEENTSSFFGLYPKSKKILNLENDLETIRLDKYYRDLLSANILNAVRIRRRIIDRIASEAIDFGLVFVMTVFAAIMALNQGNMGILPLAIFLSALASFILTLIKTK